MDQAISAYYNITAESEFRESQRLYSKARHNEAAALRHAEQKGLEKGREKEKLAIARNALAKGSTPEFVHEITGLDPETIEKLMS